MSAKNITEGNARARYDAYLNDFNEQMQKLSIIDEDNYNSRKIFLSTDQAKEIIRNRFRFDDGKRYHIKYNTSVGWRMGESFIMNQGVNPVDYVYSHADQQENYDYQALDEEDIHIFGIIVKEL